MDCSRNKEHLKLIKQSLNRWSARKEDKQTRNSGLEDLELQKVQDSQGEDSMQCFR